MMGLLSSAVVGASEKKVYQIKTKPYAVQKSMPEGTKAKLLSTKLFLSNKAEEYRVLLSHLQSTPANCFLSTAKHNQLLESAAEQLNQIQLRIKECERLEDLCQ